ncbi:hypothetical protein DPMN_101071 [Dreissena polymorpha]|uniref:Uncharacterized protein n=1 Tax=Dreissena polymorpha TaxID=45954 RepID=A0A9D4R8S5_DREPO|nr:hypothetical protein DPMN_101071 [Dreissena polymorpha]
MIHALSGYDTTSAFRNESILEGFSHVKDSAHVLHSVENSPVCETEEAVENVVITAYDITAMSLPNTNAVRMYLFTNSRTPRVGCVA